MISPSPGGSCASQPMPRLGATITLHNSSNGGTFCVSIGQRVLVQLDSKPSRMWSPVRSDSRALVSLAYGDLMQRVGETGAIFAATHPGIAHLSSARPLCTGGPLHCDALMAFQVTVMVGGMRAARCTDQPAAQNKPGREMYQARSTPLCAGDGRAGDAPTSSRPRFAGNSAAGGAAFPANGHRTSRPGRGGTTGDQGRANNRWPSSAGPG